MLSDLELKIIENNKIPGFGARMMGLWIDYESLKTILKKGKLPSHKKIKGFFNTLYIQWSQYNLIYLHNLQEAPVNPLKLEQEAWKLLSERIKSYQEQYAEFVLCNLPSIEDSENNRQKVVEYLDGVFELLKKMKKISRSYAEKYDIAVYRGRPGFTNVKDEQWFKNVPLREQEVKELIKELSDN